MKNQLKFVWIDDNPDREQAAKNLESQLEVKVDFIGVKNKSIDDELKDLISKSEPDLIILDHSLNDTKSATYKTGSTAASYLHEEWHNCPIISLTGVNILEVDIRHRSAYEVMYPINKISEYYDSIYSIAVGFKTMKEKEINNVNDLIELFKPPENDIEKIKKILPKELKENFSDKSLLLEIYRWFESVFSERAGFLYNRDWAATLLGLNLAGFQKVEKEFEEAKYSGIFNINSKERWWKSKLLNLLGEKTDKIGLPWVIGRSLVSNEAKYFSICHASDESFPETVAAEDETRDANWFPMKLKYTEPHPNFENMLFFEELRIMKPA